eukprot:TRINITY_DN11782_c0_g2_i1.p2 TRINITY_DN11782_c0_g2~~TRINITY_DN11782_c0_g2_i1.p2  ORF type:complete len:155 (-),score=29.14 TRINITY_DN11782_c0_g2_i1:35-499(-)
MFVFLLSVSDMFFFFLMIRRPPRSTHCISSAASDVYKRQVHGSTWDPGLVRPLSTDQGPWRRRSGFDRRLRADLSGHGRPGQAAFLRHPADEGGAETKLKQQASTQKRFFRAWMEAVSYTHLRAHETRHDLVCRLLLEKKKKESTGTVGSSYRS